MKRKNVVGMKLVKAKWYQLVNVPVHVMELRQCLPLERTISEYLDAIAMVVNVFAKPLQLMMELVIVFSTRDIVCTDSEQLVNDSLKIHRILKILRLS